MVIGAVALNHHVPLERSTADVDFVIVAEEAETAALLRSLHWDPDAHQQHRWRDRHRNAVDVVPATSEVIAAGTVTLERDERVLSTVGLDLALEHATPVAIPGSDGIVEVASLAAIVVLKMVAWLDRPHERERDVRDLGRVFEAALDDWDERRWQAPLADLEHEVQAAFFVGQQVRGIIRAAHRVEVERFVQRVATDAWLDILGAGGLVCTDPELVAQRRLAAFRRGLG